MSDSGWGAPGPFDGGGVPPDSMGSSGMTPEQLAYRRGQQDAIKALTTPRMTVFRAICGILWALIALGFGAGAIYNLVDSNVGEFLIGLVIAVLAGWYDYRIWTLKARRLWLII